MAFKGDDSTLSLTTTVTLALAVAAMVLTKNPLQSSRPSSPGTGVPQTTGELKVPARLWEDPFAAVEKSREAQKQIVVQVVTDGAKVGAVSATVADQPQGDDGMPSLKAKIEASDGPILALIVMTQGDSSIEGSEARMRDRYAVGAALEVGCYSPDKDESLSYFVWNFPPLEQAKIFVHSNRTRSKSLIPKTDSKLPSLYTPYEWYGRNVTGNCHEPVKSDNSIRAVLVLWMKAQEGEDRILARISELSSKFPQISIKLIGPRTSSEFRSILEEIERRNPHNIYRWQQLDKMLEVYSPWATAMAGVLLQELKSWKGEACQTYSTCEKAMRELLKTGGLDLSYRVTSDDLLFESILKELSRRRVAVGNDKIVLIGEWDSFYARALPFSFTAGMHQYFQKVSRDSAGVSSHAVELNPNEVCRSIGQIDPLRAGALCSGTFNISQYSYLSGLDGESSEVQAKRSKLKKEDRGKDKTEDKERFRDIDSYERPEGPSQLDYVRRLVTRIKSEQPKVKAIGILGRDTYDALLILQAVREQFPGVLFFTTDLDARYFHEDEQKWTRNLIVASQFGLQLDPSLQQSIPPFRSSLQTSAFFAVLRAIGRVRIEESGKNPTFKLLGQEITNEFSNEIPPRLFEIGRRGSVDLSPVGQINGLPTIHPARIDVARGTGRFLPPPQIGFLWIVGLTLGFLTLWGYGRLWNWLTAREESDFPKSRFQSIARSAWVAIPVVMALVFVCWIAYLETYPEEEPFSWTDGVSIWPTEALRFIAMCLSLFFLFKARADSVRNIDELTKSFSLGLPSDPKVAGWRDRMKGFWSDLNWMFHGSKQDHPGDLKDLWMRYRRAHGFLPRAARIAMGFVAYLFLLLPLVLVANGGELRHSVPCRGEFSCTVDSIALTGSVLSFLILNLALLDAVILCTKWIQEMPAATSRLSSMQKIRLIVERSTVVNRRVVHPFLVLFLLVAARNHYFDNWDFPPGLILALTLNSLVLITSATLLYVSAVQAKRRMLAFIQKQLDDAMARIEGGGLEPIQAASGPSSDLLRQIITDIDGIQQGAFVPFYQQPMVQATLVAALAFLQYWYLGQ
ncbi:MAG: hypothetical protein JSS48_15545 [Nitrospira sp.]|nr:hypothetical protein [Nitrospira sp.]